MRFPARATQNSDVLQLCLPSENCFPPASLLGLQEPHPIVCSLAFLTRLRLASVGFCSLVSEQLLSASLSSGSSCPSLLGFWSLSLQRSKTCAFCSGLSAWVLLPAFGSENASRQEAGAITGLPLFVSLLRVHCPVAQYLETLVSCILSSFPAVYGNRANLIPATPLSVAFYLLLVNLVILTT